VGREMGYKCLRCGREYDNLPERFICECGYRIFVKTRPPIVRKVKAR